MKRILIMAVPIGSGHIQAAKAIRNHLAKDGNFDVHYANAFDWAFPIYGPIYKAVYDLSVLYFRPLLKFFYNNHSIASASFHSVPKMHEILIYRMEELFEAVEPDVIIATHFSPAHFASVLKHKYNYKLYVMVTDYHFHAMWLTPDVDSYFIGHEDMIKNITLPKWAGRDKFIATGLPVREIFHKRLKKYEARNLIGLDDDRPLVLVMGGRIFGGPWISLIKKLIKLPINLIVLTGRNNWARRRVLKYRGKGKAYLEVHGLVEKIHHYMMAADLVISKAGGLTTAESLVGKVPLVFANSLPGLERYNELFFLDHNASYVLDVKKVQGQVWDLLKSDELKERIRNFHKIAKPYPAQNIVNEVKRGFTNV